MNLAMNQQANAYAQNYNNELSPAVPDSPIAQAMSANTTLISDIEKSIEMLRRRLEPVLAIGPISGKGAGGSPAPVVPELRQRLTSHNDALAGLRAQIVDITDRLEL